MISGNTGTVTRFEEHDLAVTYTGTWWLVMRPDVSGGTCLKGQDPGSTHLPQQVAYSATNLPAGPDVLTIEVTGTYNSSSCCARIAIDAFDVTSGSSSSRRGPPRR